MKEKEKGYKIKITIYRETVNGLAIMMKNKLQRRWRPRRRSPSTTPGLGTLAAAASATACTVELSRSSGRGKKEQGGESAESWKRIWEEERRKVNRKRTREHELVTWLDENEPAENGRFVDCERPDTRYVRDNVAYISYLRSCKRH